MSTPDSSSTNADDPSYSSSMNAVDPPRSALSADASRDDSLQRLLVETHAAFDVLLEMNALMYADGDQEEYRETLTALKQRHQQAVQDVRTEFFGPSSPDASPLKDNAAPDPSS